MIKKLLLWLLRGEYELVRSSRIKVYKSSFAITNSEMVRSGDIQQVTNHWVKKRSIEMVAMMLKDGVMTLEREDKKIDDTVGFRMKVYAIKTGKVK